MPSSSNQADGKFTIALIAMPWPLFNRPAVQLGALKAYLASRADWLQVQNLHPYLEVARLVGCDQYHWLSQHSWLSEALYAAIAFPSRRESAGILARRLCRRHKPPDTVRFDFETTVSRLQQQLLRYFDAESWQQYGLAGFSVCTSQLFSSLAAAGLVKKKYPAVPIVFGGSSCTGEMGRSLLELPQVDYVVQGEGEIPLFELCEYLHGRRRNLPAAVICRPIGKTGAACGQSARPADLPPPDYHDYMKEMRRQFTHSPFIPVLPVEFSRGCWWGKCSFCNLNLQWRGFRQKSADQMRKEVTLLAREHESLDFAFMDNALPPGAADTFFRSMTAEPADFRFFAEIRLPGRKAASNETFPVFRRGGLTTVQIGIEALSDSLLQRMHKGVSVVANIAAMRDAQENHLFLEGNLIVEFPGSTEQEVEETLRHLQFVLPYHPLSPAVFFLGSGSPMDNDPARYGIRAVTRHSSARYLLPPPLDRHLRLPVKGFRGDRQRQRRLWQPVVREIANWHEFHRRRFRNDWHRPPLSFRDGGDFLIIRQETRDNRVLHHRLRGLSRKMYLRCRRPVTTKELQESFPAVKYHRLTTFLADLEKKRLLFMQNGTCLSLAVQSHSIR